MATAVHVIYAAVQIALLVMSIRLFLRDRHWTQVMLSLSIAGLVYDNLVVGLGHLIGAGSTLMALNYPRFLVHALITPFLSLVGLTLARNTTIEWAWMRRTAIAFWALTIAMLGWGFYNDVILLAMEPATFAETLRYTNSAVQGPPIPALVVMVLLMFSGIGILVRTRWPWLLISSIFMFTAAAFAASIGVIANLGELALVLGLVLTSQRFPLVSRAEMQARQAVLSPAERERLAEEQRGRKRTLAIGNRWMAWVMAPLLLIGTLAHYRAELGITWLDRATDLTANNIFIIMFFIHATASFYFYGVPKPRANIRVAHVYIGYGVFLFTMISQSLFGVEPLHMITYIINWVFIGAHLALSLRFMLKRVTRQKQDPMLEIVVSKRLATTSK